MTDWLNYWLTGLTQCSTIGWQSGKQYEQIDIRLAKSPKSVAKFVHFFGTFAADNELGKLRGGGGEQQLRLRTLLALDVGRRPPVAWAMIYEAAPPFAAKAHPKRSENSASRVWKVANELLVVCASTESWIMQNKMPANCRHDRIWKIWHWRSPTPSPPALKINRQGFEVTPSLVSKTAANKKKLRRTSGEC